MTVLTYEPPDDRYEDHWESGQYRSMKPCPACANPIELHEKMCSDCLVKE